MSFSQLTHLIAELMSAPLATLVSWRGRSAFRRQLKTLSAEPHLVADLGFDPLAVRAEIARRPWQPVRLRRGAEISRDGLKTVARPASLVSPATAQHF